MINKLGPLVKFKIFLVVVDIENWYSDRERVSVPK